MNSKQNQGPSDWAARGVPAVAPSSARGALQKLLWNLLRWTIPLMLLAYLFYDASRDGAFARLEAVPKHWHVLLLALGFVTAATLLAIGRWYLLVLTVDIRLSPAGALRLGFLAELFNLISIGSVGGDLVKAVLLARDQPGRRARAVATVLVDRVIGLYALFLVASLAILATGAWRSTPEQLRLVCQATVLLALAGTCGLLVLAATKVAAQGAWARRLSRVPWVGPPLAQVMEALGHYRNRWPMVLVAIMMSIGVHCLLAVSVFLIAVALTSHPPSLARHLVIMPLATTTGVLPLPLCGLGAFEYVLETLYQQFAGTAAAASGAGLLVALGYRTVSLGMVAIGIGVYLAAQREVTVAVRKAATFRRAL